MELRRIISIDEGLCDGCGLCVQACAEGALRIIGGKARLLDEAYCDGLGACIGYCPKGAIIIEERAAKPFLEAYPWGCGCLNDTHEGESSSILRSSPPRTGLPTKGLNLSNWPIKLMLVPTKATYYQDREILVAADCVPFAYQDLYHSLMAGRSVVIGCPKFEDARVYAEKIGEILRWNRINGVTVVHMEVPCCHGLRWAIDRAVEASGKNLPIKRLVVTVHGELKEAKEI